MTNREGSTNEMELQGRKTSGTALSLRNAMKKATAEMLILYYLQKRPMYAYEVTQMIANDTNGVLAFNTMYFAFHRLKDNNFIAEYRKDVSEDNRIRIYFNITDAGISYWKSLVEEYRKITKAISEIITSIPLPAQA